MESHIKILGILHVILGGMGLLAAVIVFAVFGGLAGLASTSGDGGVGFAVLSGIGGIITILVLMFSLPGFIGGIALLKMAPWSRVYMIVISALHLIHVPFGTALGIYGLWALTKPETEALFQRRAYRTA
jgi:hypothetical protein